MGVRAGWFLLIAGCGSIAAPRPVDTLTATDFEDETLMPAAEAAECFSRFLARFQEPRLQPTRMRGAEAYRFLWIDSEHVVCCVRIERQPEGSARVHYQQLDAHGDAVVVQRTTTVPASDWREWRAQLEASRFWQTDARKGALLLCGGSDWILEGADFERRHLVWLQSPDDPAVRACWSRLLEMAGVEQDL